MNWQKPPTGMIRHDELNNILVGAYEAGLDPDTLAIIARQTGVREYYDRDISRLQRPKITVERSAVMLLEE